MHKTIPKLERGVITLKPLRRHQAYGAIVQRQDDLCAKTYGLIFMKAYSVSIYSEPKA